MDRERKKGMNRQEFTEYYNYVFSEDLQALYSSYVKDVEPNNSFLGFVGVEHLKHIDVTLANHAVNNHKLELIPTDKRDLFFLSLSLMAATDICIYSFYPEVKDYWYQMSQYPKITGWNYYAEAPAYYLVQLLNVDKIDFLRDICRDTAQELKQFLHIDDKKDLSIEEIIWRLLTDSHYRSFDCRCFLKP